MSASTLLTSLSLSLSLFILSPWSSSASCNTPSSFADFLLFCPLIHPYACLCTPAISTCLLSLPPLPPLPPLRSNLSFIHSTTFLSSCHPFIFPPPPWAHDTYTQRCDEKAKCVSVYCMCVCASKSVCEPRICHSLSGLTFLAVDQWTQRLVSHTAPRNLCVCLSLCTFIYVCVFACVCMRAHVCARLVWIELPKQVYLTYFLSTLW